MARASFIVRKDGRYFFHKRFASIRSLPGRPTHMRLSLRTGVYREAVDRMLGVMRVVQVYEVDEAFLERAIALMAEMNRLNAAPGGYHISQMVERRALEILVDRFIGEARQANHPIAVSPENFWSSWMSFCAVNSMLEESAFTSKPSPSSVCRSSDASPRMGLPTAEVELTEDRRVHSVQNPSDADRKPNDDVTRSVESVSSGAVFNRPTENGKPAVFGPSQLPVPIGEYIAVHTPTGGPVADPFDMRVDPEFGPNARISKILVAYLKQHATKVGDGRAREDVEIIIQFVIDLCGDLRMNEITSEDLQHVEEALPDVPHPKSIPADHQTSMFRRYIYAQQHGWDGLKRVSKTRIRNGWHRCLRQFFDWARSKSVYPGQPYTFDLVGTKNPAAKNVDAWTEDEILKLFSLPLFTGCHSAKRHWTVGNRFVQSELYWAYLMIFFMGIRPSEIGRTRLVDFAEIEGRWYIDYRDKTPDGEKEERVKAEASARLIPIPRLLIDLGLLDRRDDLLAMGGEMLFPEWKRYIHKKSGRILWGHTFSKSWQYVRKEFEFQRKDLKLYGGRHTRATWYDSLDLPHRIRLRVMGHKPKEVADMYGAIHVTPHETELLLSKEMPVEVKIADILLTAKLRADYRELITVKTY